MIRRVGFLEAFKLFWKNYVNFKGRSTRSEYWFAALWMLILSSPFLIGMLMGLLQIIVGFTSLNFGIVSLGFSIYLFFLLVYLLIVLAIFIPAWAIIVRRFHDTGRTMTMPFIMFVLTVVMYVLSGVPDLDVSTELTLSSFLFLLFCLAYLGLWIYMIVILCQPSQDKDNKYGRSPYVQRFEQGNAPASNVSPSESAKVTKGSSSNSSHGSSSEF